MQVETNILLLCLTIIPNWCKTGSYVWRPLLVCKCVYVQYWLLVWVCNCWHCRWRTATYHDVVSVPATLCQRCHWTTSCRHCVLSAILLGSFLFYAHSVYKLKLTNNFVSLNIHCTWCTMSPSVFWRYCLAYKIWVK